MTEAETANRTENGGFKRFFKSYGIFFIVSAALFAAACLCKAFVFSFENNIDYGSHYQFDLDDFIFLGERFDNETVKKIPLDFFFIGVDEVLTLQMAMGKVEGMAQSGIMGALIFALISPIYMRLIYVGVSKKLERKATRLYEKITEFISLYFLENAMLYFITVGLYHLYLMLEAQNMVLIWIVGIVLDILVIPMILPYFLSYANVFLTSSFAFPYVVTISNALNEAMVNGGIEEPQLGIILSVIAVAMVLALIFVREKLNDLIVKLILKLFELVSRLFRKIKGLFKRKA